MAARHDVQDLLLVGHLRHGERQRGIDVAEQKIDLVAVDELARLLHRGAGVAAGRILDDEFDVAPENAAFGVDLLDRELAADKLVLARPGVGACERIIEADLDGVRRPGPQNEWTGDLRDAEDNAGLQQATTGHAALQAGDKHGILP